MSSQQNRFVSKSLRAAAIAVGMAFVAPAAQATDGSLPPPPSRHQKQTHYEKLLEETPLALSIAPSPGLPDRLHLIDADFPVQYRQQALRPDEQRWEVRIRDFVRQHERPDVVYDMVLVIPLPADTAGGDAFALRGPGVELYEGSEERAQRAVYAGREMVLRRNRGLEQALLPALLTDADETGKLPRLEGTGYRYTFWDAVVRYDPAHGEAVRGWASLRYSTDARVAAPDAGDERLAAYWMTWIPSLPTSVPPYTLRLDVSEPQD